MVALLAPHIAEDLWSRLGHPESLVYADFPQSDSELARARTVTIPVQVNGKTKFTLDTSPDASAAEIDTLVSADPRYAEHTQRLTVRRVIIVPGQIVNIVASPAS